MSGIGLQQNLTLGQTLSPQMQQSLQFLQAPALELQSLVQQELEINPVLEDAAEQEKPLNGEASENSESPETPERTKEDERKERDEEWDKEFDTLARNEEEWRDYFAQNNSTNRYSQEAAERRQFLFDSQVEAPRLSDHLQRQLTFATTDPTDRRIGEEIIGNLDDAGYLGVTLEDIAISCQVEFERAAPVLELIQGFDPAGVGARDLQECLLLQLRRMPGDHELETTIVAHYMDRLGRKKYQEIARALKVPLERIQAATRLIATLQPRPGSVFATEDKQNVVQPELSVSKQNGDWVVALNNDPLPRLRISDTYKDLLASNGNDRGLRDYLKDKIRAGKFLIKCLHQRQQTISNIANQIVKHQKEFLENGVASLKPLTMNQVAEEVGVHETTVSRAIANKYIQTPWGVYELKYFFTPGYQTSSGEVMSNTSVKDAIQDLVARENPRKPLSDQEIVKILGERGIPLARRTVAKYRAELNILPSNLRRQC
ncbi:MAG: RNA polymerase factor sigma-54 [Verrucomicrobiota bacterium]